MEGVCQKEGAQKKEMEEVYKAYSLGARLESVASRYHNRRREMARKSWRTRQAMRLVKRIGKELRQAHGDAKLPDYMKLTPFQREVEEARRQGLIK